MDEKNDSWLLTCINENGTISFWKVNYNISETAPLLVNTTELNIIVHTLHWHCVNDKLGKIFTYLKSLYVVRYLSSLQPEWYPKSRFSKFHQFMMANMQKFCSVRDVISYRNVGYCAGLPSDNKKNPCTCLKSNP